MADTAASPPRRPPSPWIYLCAVPIVLVMGLALVRDPGRVGEPIGDIPMGFMVVVLSLMTALMVGVWVFSFYRHRTTVVILQVSAMWVGGVLIGLDLRPRVTHWDLAESGFLLVTTLLQLAPGRSRPTGRVRDPAPPAAASDWPPPRL